MLLFKLFPSENRRNTSHSNILILLEVTDLILLEDYLLSLFPSLSSYFLHSIEHSGRIIIHIVFLFVRCVLPRYATVKRRQHLFVVPIDVVRTQLSVIVTGTLVIMGGIGQKQRLTRLVIVRLRATFCFETDKRGLLELVIEHVEEGAGSILLDDRFTATDIGFITDISNVRQHITTAFEHIRVLLQDLVVFQGVRPFQRR